MKNKMFALNTERAKRIVDQHTFYPLTESSMKTELDAACKQAVEEALGEARALWVSKLQAAEAAAGEAKEAFEALEKALGQAAMVIQGAR